MRIPDEFRGLFATVSAWLWLQVAWQVLMLLLVGLALRVTAGLFAEAVQLLRAGGW